MPPDYIHWFEAGLAALAALGAWIWRVAAKMQSHDERLASLQAALKAEMEKRGERDARMFARLDELGRVQAAQGAKLDHIAETCAETRQIALDNSIVRRPGGRRNYDPPEEP